MRNKILSVVLVFFFTLCAPVLFSQEKSSSAPEKNEKENKNAGDKDVSSNKETDQEIVVDPFESSLWKGSMDKQQGSIVVRPLKGKAMGKEAPAGSENIPTTDISVMGIKVTFSRRAIGTIVLKPSRPIPVPGYVQSLSVWADGRNTEHLISILVEDINGKELLLPLGKLNFYGWKQLKTAVPPNKLVQHEKGMKNSGLLIKAIQIKTSINDSKGVFYLYLDDLRAVTNLVEEKQYADEGSISDAW